METLPDKQLHIAPYSPMAISEPSEELLSLKATLKRYDQGLSSIATQRRLNPQSLLKYHHKGGIFRDRKKYDPKQVDRIQFLSGSDPDSEWLIEMQLKNVGKLDGCFPHTSFYLEIRRDIGGRYDGLWLHEMFSHIEDAGDGRFRIPKPGRVAYRLTVVRTNDQGEIESLSQVASNSILRNTQAIISDNLFINRSKLNSRAFSSKYLAESEGKLRQIIGRLPFIEVEI